MRVLAHMGGADEIAYVLLPALIFFAVYRLVRGRRERPDAEDGAETAAQDGDPARRAGPG